MKTHFRYFTLNDNERLLLLAKIVIRYFLEVGPAFVFFNIHPVLHLFAFVLSFTHVSCSESHLTMNPYCPVSSIPSVLNPSCHVSLLSRIPPVLKPSRSKTLMF